MLRALDGSQRYILDYLLEEVLHGQPHHVQHFLLQTAILDLLSGPLCDAVMGVANSEPSSTQPEHQPYSQLILEAIERQNLFLIPLDDERRWYRYHHLFATALRAILHQRAPELVGELHRRASAWYLAHANGDELLIDSAFAHAQASRQVEQTVTVVEQLGPVLLERYASQTLRTWLDAVPALYFERRPRLAQLRAWLLILEGDMAGAEPWVARAEALLPSDLTETEREESLSEMAMLRGMIAWRRGELVPARTQYRYALAHLPERNVLRSVAAVNYGTLSALLGEPREAAAAFAEGVRLTIVLDRPLAVQMLCQQAQMEAILGRLGQAEVLYRQALARAEREPAAHAPYIPTAQAGLGELHYERNLLDTAAEVFMEVVEQRPHGASEAVLRAAIGMAGVHAARRDIDAAQQLLTMTERTLATQHAPAWQHSTLAAARARLALAAGNGAATSQWITMSGLHADDPVHPMHETDYMLLARIMIARGQAADTRGLLERLRQAAETDGRTGRLIVILALQALADPAHTKAIDAALQLADAAGYVRTLADLGPPLLPSLRAAAQRGVTPAYTARLLDMLASETTPAASALRSAAQAGMPLAEPLSPRELEVLHLLAGGATNQEIARRLVIAERTAKKHVTNILGKLGATNRTQAVARAHAAGLL